MTFIPNLGPILAGIPTILITFGHGWLKAFFLTILYIIIQNIEGYFITSPIHRKALAMPPALILSIQILLASLIGFLGILLAMPLTACTISIIKTLYIKEFLKENPDYLILDNTSP